MSMSKPKHPTLSKGILASIVLSGMMVAAPNIPASCSTPGSCAELTPALKSMTLKEELKITDADASHRATIKAAETTTENVIITLPATNGQPNQILATDANGHLVWEDKPHNLVGMIGFMIPDNLHGIYEINGQRVTDAKLAAYIRAHPITGFSVSGNSVTLPNWRGRYLGASGNRGIGSTPGAVMSSSNKRHSHAVRVGDNRSGTRREQIHRSAHDNGGTYRYTQYEGSSYARPETAGMPMVIIGESK